MRSVEFLYDLDSDNAMRVRFETTRGRVEDFVVQLECVFKGKPQPVVRYDTAHGYAHRDDLHPFEAEKKTDLHTTDYNRVLNFAINDIKQNWHKYRRRYEQWLTPDAE